MTTEVFDRRTVEKCAATAEGALPRAHTYADENADLYRAQDHVRDRIATAIRALPTAPSPAGPRDISTAPKDATDIILGWGHGLWQSGSPPQPRSTYRYGGGRVLKPFLYRSLCSGIEAASVAWRPLGWRAEAVAEVEAFPSAVLAHHYPEVPNLGDITKFKDWPDAAFDLLVGGTPCQSFSVAGLRMGMADPRGNLALTYLAIADRYRPEWLVWENVPGVLSSNGGRDFGAFLGGLGELGYGFAYRVLDAQFVRVDGFDRAVPQRRRRVFVVGNSRSWRRAAAVLFEPESLSGNSPPRRQAGKAIATGLAPRSGGGGYPDGGDGRHSHLIAFDGQNLACAEGASATLDSGGAHLNRGMHVAHALRADGFDASEDGTGRGTPLVPVIAKTLTRGAESSGKGGYAGRRQEDDDNLVAFQCQGTNLSADEDIAGTLRGGNGHLTGGGPAIAFTQNSRSEVREIGGDGGIVGALAADAGAQQQNYVAFSITPSNSNKDYNAREADKSQAITGGGNRPSARGGDLVSMGWAVRRLTPTECERLQGFPDGYTNVPYRGKAAADGPRYKALGNSMACNVMRWIGRRIELVNALTAEIAA